MVVGTLSLVQKGQTSGCSTQWNSGIVVYGGGDIVLWCKKVKPVDAVDAVCSAIVICGGGDTVCSGIVVYDGGDIVFGAKRSNQRTQWMQYAVQ